MVRRNLDLSFGGQWTFPGGVLEDRDGPLPEQVLEETQNWGDPTLLMTAANGAARETLEETALVCAVSSLVWFSHWVPPVSGIPKRFATWFFLAPEAAGTIEVDAAENSEARWVKPAAALDLYADGSFPLAVPTWVTLDDLSAFESAGVLLDRTLTMGPRFHQTKRLASDGGLVLVWQGDAAYENGEVDTPGARNRVIADPSGSVIERLDDGR